MAINGALKLLKATADPSRLRLLALLASGEATVGELVEVLGQSQPRVSRHLRILSDARLVSHFRDGQWVYYRLDPAVSAADLAARIVSLARARDDLIARDQARMTGIRRGRERYAYAAATGPRRWAETGADRPDEAALDQALRDALADPAGGGSAGDVLDIGVGSGALLRLLAPRARSAVGLDISKGMRVLARSRLQEAGLGLCTIRAGDMHALQFPDLSFDVVVLDEVLALTDKPRAVLAEAARVLRPAGRLLILDRILPAALRLPSQKARRALFENQLTVMLRGLIETHVYDKGSNKLYSRTVQLPGYDILSLAPKSLADIDFLLEHSSVIRHEIIFAKIKALQELNNKYGQRFGFFHTDTITLYGNRDRTGPGCIQEKGFYLNINAVHFNYFTKASNSMNTPMPDVQQSYAVGRILECRPNGTPQLWPKGFIGHEVFANIAVSCELLPLYAKASPRERVTKLIRNNERDVLAAIEGTLVPEAMKTYENYFNTQEFNAERLRQIFGTRK